MGAWFLRVPDKKEGLISVWLRLRFVAALNTYQFNCNFLVCANVGA